MVQSDKLPSSKWNYGVDGEETVKRASERDTFAESVLRRLTAVPPRSFLRRAGRVSPVTEDTSGAFGASRVEPWNTLYPTPDIHQGWDFSILKTVLQVDRGEHPKRKGELT